MGFIKRLLNRFRRDYDEYDEEEWEEESSREIDFDNKEQRSDYVKNCLEKIADATKELENLNFEYNMVTSYLKDMEEIEALPPEESEQLKDCAKRVSLYKREKRISWAVLIGLRTKSTVWWSAWKRRWRRHSRKSPRRRAIRS